jgi:hypothetical protein
MIVQMFVLGQSENAAVSVRKPNFRWNFLHSGPGNAKLPCDSPQIESSL